MLERVQQQALEQDRKRQCEWEQREKRVEDAMNRMANSVIKQKDEHDRKLEDKIRQYEDEKQRRDDREELRRQTNARKNNDAVKEALRAQLLEKHRMK